MICQSCHLDLPQDSFRFDRIRNRYRTSCKECSKKAARAHYQALKIGQKIAHARTTIIPTTRTCTQCYKDKPLTEFPHNIANPTKLWHWKSACRECCKSFQRTRLKQGYKRPSTNLLEHKLLTSRRHSYKNHKLEIGVEHIRRLINIQTDDKLLCGASKVPLSTGLLKPSIDRIFNDLGYIPGNIRITSLFYNLAKHTMNDAKFRRTLLNPIEYKISIKQTATNMFNNIYNRRSRIPHSISIDNIMDLINQQTVNGILKCKITGMPLGGDECQQPSIDRIDSTQGYMPNNIQIVSDLYNRGKNTSSDIEASNAYKLTVQNMPQLNAYIMPLDCRLPMEYLRQFDIIIYEDEWLNKRTIINNILSSKAGTSQYISGRASDCKITLIDSKLAIDFYNQYNYIGGCTSKYNIGAYYNNDLVACLSIRKPSRQDSGDWEISRMASNIEFKIHGIWSKIIKWIRDSNLISGSLVTYSDNRLFAGMVYGQMGMIKANDIPPDYYWCKNKVRYHKSAMRKTEEERKSGRTESQLRIAQGYHKVYDVGKIKWSMTL